MDYLWDLSRAARRGAAARLSNYTARADGLCARSHASAQEFWRAEAEIAALSLALKESRASRRLRQFRLRRARQAVARAAEANRRYAEEFADCDKLVQKLFGHIRIAVGALRAAGAARRRRAEWCGWARLAGAAQRLRAKMEAAAVAAMSPAGCGVSGPQDIDVGGGETITLVAADMSSLAPQGAKKKGSGAGPEPESKPKKKGSGR